MSHGRCQPNVGVALYGKKRGETCHEWYEDVNARGDTLGDECGF